MKYFNKKCIAVAIILSVLFSSVILGLYNSLPEWFMVYYFKVIIATFFIIFLAIAKYFYEKKCLTVFLITFIAVFILAVITMMIQEDQRMRKQDCFYQFNQILENPDPEDIIGVSLASLPVSEEKEIQEIIKKALEGQLLYRYYYKNEGEMDELIENLYLSEKYQQFKKGLKEKYEYVSRENSLKEISYSLKKIRFSKLRKYEDFNDRIGIIAKPEFGSTYYFLFKKVNGQWKIEREILPDIRLCYFNEVSIIQQLLEQENNETPDWKVYQNKELGFRVDYPENWEIKEYNEYDDQHLELTSFQTLELIEEQKALFDGEDYGHWSADIMIYYSYSVVEEYVNKANKLGATTIDELIEKDDSMEKIGEIKIGDKNAIEVIEHGEETNSFNC